MAKFTFKKNQSTGRYRTFDPDSADIKLNKKVVGHIQAKGGSICGPWRISLAIKKECTENDPAPFKWITLKAEFDSIDAAKNKINESAEAIINKFNLYSFD